MKYKNTESVKTEYDAEQRWKLFPRHRDPLGFMLPSSTIPNLKQQGQMKVSGWMCQANTHTNTQGRVNKDSQKR